MFSSRDRPRFNLKLKIIELANVPQLSGSALVRWHLTDHRRNDYRGRTDVAQIRNHRAEWGYSTAVEFRMRIDDDKMLHGSSIMFDVFVESKEDRQNDKTINSNDRNHLGRVELNLAEYAQDEPITHRYLLRKSKVNSLLNITIEMEQVRGDTDYMIPPLATAHIFGLLSSNDNGETAESEHKDYRRSFARGYFVSPQGVSVNKCIDDIFHGGDGFNDGGKGMFYQEKPKKKGANVDVRESSSASSDGPSKKTSACKLRERLTFHKSHPHNPHTPAKPSPLHTSSDKEQLQQDSAGMPRTTNDNALGVGPHTSAQEQEPAGVNIGGKHAGTNTHELYRGYNDFRASRREQRREGKAVENYVINSAPSGMTMPRATDLLNGYISWYVVDEVTGVEEEGQNLMGGKMAKKNHEEQKLMHDEFMRERIGVLAEENKARAEVEKFNKEHGIDKPAYEPLPPKSQGILPELAHAQAVQSKDSDSSSPDPVEKQQSTQPAFAKHSRLAVSAYEYSKPKEPTTEPSNSEQPPEPKRSVEYTRNTYSESVQQPQGSHSGKDNSQNGKSKPEATENGEDEVSRTEPSFDVNDEERSATRPELLTQAVKDSAIPGAAM